MIQTKEKQFVEDQLYHLDHFSQSPARCGLLLRRARRSGRQEDAGADRVLVPKEKKPEPPKEKPDEPKIEPPKIAETPNLPCPAQGRNRRGRRLPVTWRPRLHRLPRSTSRIAFQ